MLLPPSLPPSLPTPKRHGTTEGEGSAQPAYFAANRPREFPFAPRFGVLSPSPPLDPSLPRPQISSFTTCRGQQTNSTALCLMFVFSSRPPQLSSFFLSFFPYPTFRSIEREKFEKRRFVRGQNLNAAAAATAAGGGHGAKATHSVRSVLSAAVK